jgi:hypothetical protein
MRKCNFTLRLQPSLLTEARRVAEAEVVALKRLINMAVAEKLSALRTKVQALEGVAVREALSRVDMKENIA